MNDLANKQSSISVIRHRIYRDLAELEGIVASVGLPIAPVCAGIRHELLSVQQLVDTTVADKSKLNNERK